MKSSEYSKTKRSGRFGDRRERNAVRSMSWKLRNWTGADFSRDAQNSKEYMRGAREVGSVGTRGEVGEGGVNEQQRRLLNAQIFRVRFLRNWMNFTECRRMTGELIRARFQKAFRKGGTERVGLKRIFGS